jgi:hypothetical protein
MTNRVNFRVLAYIFEEISIYELKKKGKHFHQSKTEMNKGRQVISKRGM